MRAPRERFASRTGAMMRQNVVDSYLGRAGIGTHGDGPGRRVAGARMGVFGDPSPVQLGMMGDLCDSAGTTTAGAFTAAGGDSGLFTSIGTATGADAGATSALGVASALSTFVGGLWGQQCTLQAARTAAATPTTSSQPSDMTAAFQQSISQALAQSQQSQQQATQAALAQQAAAQQASQRNTMMIVGGVALGAVVLLGGAFLLLRK